MTAPSWDLQVAKRNAKRNDLVSSIAMLGMSILFIFMMFRFVRSGDIVAAMLTSFILLGVGYAWVAGRERNAGRDLFLEMVKIANDHETAAVVRLQKDYKPCFHEHPGLATTPEGIPGAPFCARPKGHEMDERGHHGYGVWERVRWN